MAAGIYTTRLFASSVAGGDTLSYVVPEGYVCVVTDVEMVAQTGSESGYVTGAGVAFYISYFSSSQPFVHAQWTGRAAVDAGESVTVGANGGNIQFFVTAYLLTA